MLKAIVAAVIVYVLADAVWGLVLKPFGLSYMHAFLAMFCGMLVGGCLATRSFIVPAITINVVISGLTYVLIAGMRGQSPFALLLEQHPMVSIGSFAGAIMGAWLGRKISGKKAAA